MANINQTFKKELEQFCEVPYVRSDRDVADLMTRMWSKLPKKIQHELAKGLARPVQDEMKIIPYSDKSFAVIGEQTILYRDELMELGGTYNPNLKCGKGWIFSNKHTDEVKNFLTALYAKGKGRVK